MRVWIKCLTTVCLVGCGVLNAMTVNENNARLTAESWIARSEVFKASGLRHTVAKVTPVTLNNTSAPECYHVALNPQGYIVVSGDKRIMPVICFSLTGNLNLAESPQNALRAMLSADLKASYAALMAADNKTITANAGAAENNTIFTTNKREWDELNNATAVSATRNSAPGTLLVAPMLETRWSQWNHYNDLCPETLNAPAGYDGRCPVGCVAVVGAQLMKYYEWPRYGQGSHAYTDSSSSVTGFHSRIFADTYDWDNMLTNYLPYSSDYTSDETAAIAELMYEVGVAVEMNYEANGSSSNLRSLSGAMNEYFSYRPSERLERADNTALYDQKLRDDILAGRPVPMSIPGHAILADGLSADSGTNYFHINYGWGGNNDGWYRPSNIPGGSADDALFGAEPQLKPLFVNPGTLTNLTGNFTCYWTLAEKRTGDVSRLRIKEGQFAASNRLDSADNFNAWERSRWELSSSGLGGGNCFYKKSQFFTTTSLTLIESVQADTATALRFHYKPKLYKDTFSVQISSDTGVTWTDMFLTSNRYENSWSVETLDLSAYDGQIVNLRFRYTGKGSLYTSGGIWLDDISISNCSMLAWTTLDTNIATSTSSYELTGCGDGVRRYSVEANDGSDWIALWKPLKTVNVDVSGDADNDGMNNGWEYEYFGNPTGAVASADADNDLMSNSDECFAGTNPTNITSRLEVFEGSRVNNGYRVYWSSITGKSYSLWRSEEIVNGSFSCISSNIAATPDMNSYIDLNSTNIDTCYYRVLVEP